MRIDGKHVWDDRNCAACRAVFKIRRRYVWTTYVLALAVSVGTSFAIGNRGNAFSSLAGLLVLPTFWAMLMINLRLFPVDIEIVREGWTPGDSERDRDLERDFEVLRELDVVVGRAELETFAPRLEELTNDAPAGRLPLSTPNDPPLTLEGILVAIVLTALLAYHVYMAIEPHF